MPDDGPAAGRAQVAALAAELTRLRVQYDLLMNRFEFDAAHALVPRIEAAERERAALAADLPPPAAAPSAPYAVARRSRRR